MLVSFVGIKQGEYAFRLSILFTGSVQIFDTYEAEIKIVNLKILIYRYLLRWHENRFYDLDG